MGGIEEGGGRFGMTAIWKTAKLTANFRKSPVDGAKPGEPSQWVAAKFPVRPNRQIKSP
jgi:hypothetical protein